MVFSAGMRGLGLALVLGRVVLIQSIVLSGVGSAPGLQATPGVSTADDTTGLQEDGGYVLTQHDREYVDYTWDRSTKAEQRAACSLFKDGVSDADMELVIGRVEEQGNPVPEEWEASFRARFECTAVTYC